MATTKTKHSERFFERSLKRHFSKLTDRGLEPDEACSIAIQLATRPGPSRVFDEDEEDLPVQARRPSLRAFHKAIALAKQDGDTDALVEQLKVLFANPNNVLTPFVRSRSSSHKNKERSRHARDGSQRQEGGKDVHSPAATPSELTPEQALELELTTDIVKPTSSDSGSNTDVLFSSSELGSLNTSKPTSPAASPRAASPITAPPSPRDAPAPEPKPAPATPTRTLHTAPLPAPVLQPAALASAAAVAFGPSAFEPPPAPRSSTPVAASSPMKRIPSATMLGRASSRGRSKPTPPRPRTTNTTRPATPEPKALPPSSRHQQHDPRSRTPPPSTVPHPRNRSESRSLTPEPTTLRPSAAQRPQPRSSARSLTPEPSTTRPPAASLPAQEPSGSRPHTPEPGGAHSQLTTRLNAHQRFEPPARALARHRSVPREWSETRLADQLALPRSLSDRKRSDKPSSSTAHTSDAANTPSGAQRDRTNTASGSRFAAEALHRSDSKPRDRSEPKPGCSSGRPDSRQSADQTQAPADEEPAGDPKARGGKAADDAKGAAQAKAESKPEAVKPIPDIRAIHDFYLALQPLAQKHKEVETQLVTGGRRMRRWVAGWAPTDRKRVPIAVVCLLNPVLDNPEHHHQVTKPFLQAMAESSREVKAQLQWLLKSAPADAFARIIQSLQQYITMAIFAAPWRNVPPSGVQAAVRLLAVLWRSNQEAPRVPHTDFYNDAVNSSECPVTVKQDHARWRSTKGKEFTFCKYPFIYDPAAKTELLYCENYHQQYAEVEGAVVRAVLGGQQVLCPYLVLRVRRGRHLVQDTLEQINVAKHNHTLKKPLKVQFIGEQGVDEGGVQKELFQLLQRELFNPDYGMFTYDTTTRLHWFRPSPLNLQSEFELVGILIGLAIYNGHLLDLSFPLVLYRLLLGQAPGLQHLHELYPDVAASLKKLLAYEGDIADLCLTFEVTVEKGFGQYQQVELVAGGAGVEVTRENRDEYVRLYVKHLLQSSVQRQLGAFLKGFHRMCSGDTLDFLLPEELEQLVCGSRQLDMTALQRATQYEGGYSRHSKVVRWFWDIVHNELTPRQHKRLLSFMTGTERVPLKGLAALSPPPVIARAGPHSARLPTAHTCFNHLLLPDYAERSILRDRLRLAIDNAEGFGLI